MANIVIDLNSKIISPSQKIWVVHHGRNRNYLDYFWDQQAVFLEFPGLNLNPVAVSDDSVIRQYVRYAQAIRANKGIVRPDGTPIRIADFPGHTGHDVAIHLRTVKHLASRIIEGDLIMVPGRGAAGEVLLGEAAGPFFPQQTLRVPGIDYAPTPVRKVTWLQRRSKLDMPAQLVRYFEKPPAIAEIPRNPLTEGFFDFAYDAYSMPGRAWLSIDAPKYDGRDFLGVVPPAQLLALAVSIYRALEVGADISGLDYDQIIAAFYSEDILADAQVTFASPGRYNLKDKDGYLAQFINAFVAAAMAGALTACSAGANVDTHNSLAANDPSSAVIGEMIQQAAHSTGGAVLAKAEKQASDASRKMNLKPPAKARK